MAAVKQKPYVAPPGECRRCRTFCDKLIEPADCVEMNCKFLWSYVEGPTGRRYMGCVQKVFRGEIDIQMFDAAQREGGFGGIKMTGEPLPHCRTHVEPAVEGDGPAHTCVNPAFFDADSDFDLRDGLDLRRSA